MRGDSGVAGEGRVVEFYSWGKYTMQLTNINTSSGLCSIHLCWSLKLHLGVCN